jgi:hypothetical protein
VLSCRGGGFVNSLRLGDFHRRFLGTTMRGGASTIRHVSRESLMNMRFHRGIPGPAEEQPPRPSTSVHVLSDEQALRAALQRAAAFDQRAEEALRSRSARYRAMLGEPGAVADDLTP